MCREGNALKYLKKHILCIVCCCVDLVSGTFFFTYPFYRGKSYADMDSVVKKRRKWFKWGSISLVIISILTLLIGGYLLHWEWTGFNRTLWDWMQLLIVPAALTITGYLFTRDVQHREQTADQQKAEIERQAAEQKAQWERHFAEQQAASERFLARWRLETEMKQKEEYQREALLQAYFDRMTDLLMEKELRSSVEVLWFLYESRLLGSQNAERVVDCFCQ